MAYKQEIKTAYNCCWENLFRFGAFIQFLDTCNIVTVSKTNNLRSRGAKPHPFMKDTTYTEQGGLHETITVHLREIFPNRLLFRVASLGTFRLMEWV